jgi:hypothetical protein
VFASVWGESVAPAEPAIRAAEVKRNPAAEFAKVPVETRHLPALASVECISQEWREKLAPTTNHEGVVHQFRRLAAVLV